MLRLPFTQAQPLPDTFTYEDFAKRLGKCEARARQTPKDR